MKKLFKWAFRLFVLGLLGLFFAAFLLIKRFPQERLRAIAAEKISRKIGRQVAIGQAHLALTGLLIDDLRVSNKPDFYRGTFFTAKGVRLGWDLRTLWDGLDFKRKFITRSSGRLTIDEFHNPHYSGQDLLIRWSLAGLDPTWSHLSGWATLDQGAGLLENIDQLAASSPSAKMALAPIEALTNLDQLGTLHLGLPDLKHWPITGIKGSYEVNNGFMDIKQFEITSAPLVLTMDGLIELASGKISAVVHLTTPGTAITGPVNATTKVTGTLSDPKIDLETLKQKAFKATISNFIKNPDSIPKNVRDQLKNLFR